MTKGKISAAEKERLVVSSLRERERKQAAYQKARAVLLQRGLARIEKSVPEAKVEDIRRMIANLVELHARGMQHEIRIAMEPGDSFPLKTTPPEVITPSVAAAPEIAGRGLGAKRRKRAQNKRYRERKRAKGLKRLVLTVPASAADWISGMISQIIHCYMAAAIPVIKVSGKPMANPVFAASASPISPAPTREWTLEKPWLASSEPSEQSDLFDDIQAAMRVLKPQD